MGSTKMIGKTIGEVEKLTDIPKRKLKYMIERNLMRPFQRSETGFWLYSETDIQIARTVALLQQLDCSEKNIRTTLAASAAQWPEDLERQIAQLAERKERIEDQLFLAELLRYRNYIELDASVFSAAESNIPLAWKPGKKEALCRFLCQIVSETGSEAPLHQLSTLTDRSADDPVIQEQIQRLCDLFWQRRALTPTQFLLILRLAHTLSGLVPVLDTLLGAEGAVRLVTNAMEHYCKHLQKST